LSKRDGDQLGFPVFPLEWKDPKTGAISSGYREEGFSPETLVNMLALLGWNDGTEKVIFSIKELVESFELERVHKSGAKFDPEKTEWFQHHYMQEMSVSKLVQEFSLILKDKGIDVQDDYVKEVVEKIRERAAFVSEFWELSSFTLNPLKNLIRNRTKKA